MRAEGRNYYLIHFWGKTKQIVSRLYSIVLSNMFNVVFSVSGLDVHVVVDCCSSRSMTDRKFALERLRDIGAFLTTSECVILGLAPDAAHPKFKQIQKLVMHSAADTGLL